MKEHINRLIERAAEAQTSLEAMHLTQAAVNAANALAVLETIEITHGRDATSGLNVPDPAFDLQNPGLTAA